MQRDDAKEASAGLWIFMLAVYSRPGVAAACLRLQETHGLDVTLLLAVLYGGVTGHVPDERQILAFDHGCSAWRMTVVHPLRTARRAMKQHLWLEQQAQSQALRQRVKAAELDAERIQASFLEEEVLKIPMSSALCDVRRLGTLADAVLDIFDLHRAIRLSEDVLTIANGVLGAFGVARDAV